MKKFLEAIPDKPEDDSELKHFTDELADAEQVVLRVSTSDIIASAHTADFLPIEFALQIKKPKVIRPFPIYHLFPGKIEHPVTLSDNEIIEITERRNGQKEPFSGSLLRGEDRIFWKINPKARKKGAKRKRLKEKYGLIYAERGVKKSELDAFVQLLQSSPDLKEEN